MVLITRDDSIDGYRISERIREIEYVYQHKRALLDFEGDKIAFDQAIRYMKEKAISMGGNAVIRFRVKKTEQKRPGSTRMVTSYPFPSPTDYTPGGRRTIRDPGYILTSYNFYGYVVLVQEKGN